MHVMLPQPSLSVRVWNGTPQEFLIKAAKLTRTGVGLPAYYNDEVIIPALMNRGLSQADARDYNIIGCVEPQKAGIEYFAKVADIYDIDNNKSLLSIQSYVKQKGTNEIYILDESLPKWIEASRSMHIEVANLLSMLKYEYPLTRGAKPPFGRAPN